MLVEDLRIGSDDLTVSVLTMLRIFRNRLAISSSAAAQYKNAVSQHSVIFAIFSCG
jgi:hypothetical protein